MSDYLFDESVFVSPDSDAFSQDLDSICTDILGPPSREFPHRRSDAWGLEGKYANIIRTLRLEGIDVTGYSIVLTYFEQRQNEEFISDISEVDIEDLDDEGIEELRQAATVKVIGGIATTYCFDTNTTELAKYSYGAVAIHTATGEVEIKSRDSSEPENPDGSSALHVDDYLVLNTAKRLLSS